MKMHCYLHSTPLKEVEARVSPPGQVKLVEVESWNFFVWTDTFTGATPTVVYERSIFCRAPLRANDRCRRISGNEQATPGVSKGLVSPRLDTADFHS